MCNLGTFGGPNPPYYCGHRGISLYYERLTEHPHEIPPQSDTEIKIQNIKYRTKFNVVKKNLGKHGGSKLPHFVLQIQCCKNLSNANAEILFNVS